MLFRSGLVSRSSALGAHQATRRGDGQGWPRAPKAVRANAWSPRGGVQLLQRAGLGAEPQEKGEPRPREAAGAGEGVPPEAQRGIGTRAGHWDERMSQGKFDLPPESLGTPNF